MSGDGSTAGPLMIRPNDRVYAAASVKALPRPADEAVGDPRRRLRPAGRGRQRGGRGQRQGPPDQAVRREVVRFRLRRHVVPRRVPFAVERELRHLLSADAVGDGVVRLRDPGRRPVLQPFDERELPERAGAIERRHAHGLEELEQLSHGARRRDAGPSKVIREVEVRVDDPHRRRHRERGLDHPLPKRHDEPGDPLVGLDEPVPVGRAIEDEQRPSGSTGSAGRLRSGT